MVQFSKCWFKVKRQTTIFANKVNSFLSLYSPGEWLNDIIQENNLKKITVHGLRHTHASLLYASGVNVKEAQKRLGHSDPCYHYADLYAY